MSFDVNCNKYYCLVPKILSEKLKKLFFKNSKNFLARLLPIANRVKNEMDFLPLRSCFYTVSVAVIDDPTNPFKNNGQFHFIRIIAVLRENLRI